MTFKSIVRFFKRNYPARTKLKICLRPQSTMPGLLGYFKPTGPGRAVIAISASQNEQQLHETFLEEYAHALRHDVPIPVDGDGHDAIFWAILAALTKAYRE